MVPGLTDSDCDKEVLQHSMTMFGRNALRMKLDTMHGQGPVFDPHNGTVGEPGRNPEIIGEAVPLDNKGVVTGRTDR